MGNGFANPGFETGEFTYWSSYTNGFNNSAISVSTLAEYAGDFGVSMFSDAPFGTGVCSITQPVLFDSSTQITFKYKIQALSLSAGGDESGTADIKVYINNVLWKTKSITTTTGWLTFNETSTSYTGVYDVKIEFVISTADDQADGTAYFDNFTSEVDSTGSYTIASLSDLEDMADDVYGTYTLTQNVDASDTQLVTYNSGKGWAPVGSISQPFKGTLDGAGYKITGFEIDEATVDYKGLFGYTANDCVIKDLEIEPTTIKGKEVVGTLAGIVVGTDVDNITITGGTVYGTAFTGGVIGVLYDSTLDNCIVTASIAENDTTVDESFGGIVGLSKGSTMDTMVYTGTSINVSHKTDVGGIMGRALAVAGTGLLVSLTHGYVKTDITGQDGVGGIFGYIEYGVVDQCQFIGDITGATYVGGVFGDSNVGSISNCAASGGTVTVSGDYAGGINGYCTIGTYSNSYAAMEVDCVGSNEGAMSGGFNGASASPGSYADEDVATISASNAY